MLTSLDVSGSLSCGAPSVTQNDKDIPRDPRPLLLPDPPPSSPRSDDGRTSQVCLPSVTDPRQAAFQPPKCRIPRFTPICCPVLLRICFRAACCFHCHQSGLFSRSDGGLRLLVSGRWEGLKWYRIPKGWCRTEKGCGELHEDA